MKEDYFDINEINQMQKFVDDYEYTQDELDTTIKALLKRTKDKSLQDTIKGIKDYIKDNEGSRYEDFKEITSNFGIDNQLIKLNEEIGELLIACKNKDYFEIQEELADTCVLLTQIAIYYEIDKEEIEMVMKEKTYRTLKRIKDGYYDNHR